MSTESVAVAIAWAQEAHQDQENLKCPLKLAKRFHAVTEVPLEARLQKKYHLFPR